MFFKGIQERIKGWWIPIRFKITSPYLFLAILIAIGTGFIATQLIFDSLEERYTNQLIEAGKLSAESMVKEEDRMLKTLRLLAFTQGIPDAIQTGDAEKLRTLSFGITVDQQEDAIEFLDKDGNSILAMHHIPGGLIEEYNFSTGGGVIFSEWAFVNQVLQNQSDSYGDKFSGIVNAPWGDYFYIAGPIYNDQAEFIGAVLVGKSLPNLVAQIRADTLAQITLYDPTGQIFTSTFPEPLAITLAQAQQVFSEQDTYSARRIVNESRAISIRNIEYNEIFGPWEVRNDLDVGILGAALPKNFIVRANNITRLQVSLLVAGTIAFVILVGLILANYITRPLTKLVAASSSVAQGDFTVQIEPGTNDEISLLTNSFNQMVASLRDARQNLLDTYDETLLGWSKALELRDKETYGHTERVAKITVELARAFGMDEEAITHIRRGAILHDIGKMGISDSILHKPGSLSTSERNQIEQHTIYARNMLQNVDFLIPALDIPYHHHEKWDGSGYPDGLKGEEIPLAARIFAVADIWDALRSERPYKEPFSIQKSVNIIRKNSGTFIDPGVVQKFFECYPQFDVPDDGDLT